MKKQILLLIFIFSLTTIIAENPLSLEIQSGKSNFTITEHFPSIYASQLIEKNPEIESISIKEYGRTFGYINTLGGIGTNFLIEPNRNYEIYTNQTITIQLKD